MIAIAGGDVNAGARLGVQGLYGEPRMNANRREFVLSTWSAKIFSPRRHEGHEGKGDRGVARYRRSFSHSWHAFFPMCSTQRR